MHYVFHPRWLLFATIALVFWGITGVTKSSPPIASPASSRSSGWPGRWSPSLWCWPDCADPLASSAVHSRLSIVGGVLNGLGALTSFAALESGGKASVVISLISLYPLLTVAVGRALSA